MSDVSVDGIKQKLLGKPGDVPGGPLLNLIGVGGDDLAPRFEEIHNLVRDLQRKMEAVLFAVNDIARELAWARLGIQAHPAAMRIVAKYELLTSLHLRNKKTAERLQNAILDLNLGVPVDLITLHGVIMGKSAVDPSQPSLLQEWVAKWRGKNIGHPAINLRIQNYFTMLAQLQYKGAILLVSAHLAYDEADEAITAMRSTLAHISEQQRFLQQIWT